MADLEMTSVEISNYLKIECDSYESMANFLEVTLNVEIKRSSRYLGHTEIEAKYLYNSKEIASTKFKDRASVITGIWKHLDDDQRQKLIKAVESMQRRKKSVISEAGQPLRWDSVLPPQAPTIVNHITQNNNNSNTAIAHSISASSAVAESQSLSDLNSAINNDNKLTSEAKQEYKKLIDNLDDEDEPLGYLQILSKLLEKLANDKLLPIPPAILKNIAKALKIFNK